MPKPWRRWMVMSLRGLMLFILVFGVLLGWQVNRAHTQRRVVAMIQKAGGSVTYDYQSENGRPKGKKARPWAPVWLRRIVGDEYFQEVHGVFLRAELGKTLTVTDDTLVHVSELTRLRHLDLARCPGVTDGGLTRLRGLTGLHVLNLNGTGVTDAGLEALSGNSGLEVLELIGTKMTNDELARIKTRWGSTLRTLGLGCPGVTDAGIAHLRGMVQLRELYLIGCPRVTDAGIAQLSGLTELERLTLGGTQATDAGLVLLRGMVHLRGLFLLSTSFSDDGLAHLSGLTNLESLTLAVPVTDAGLTHLRGLKKLKTLALAQADVSDGGLAALRAELPSLTRVTNRKRPASAGPTVKPK